MSYLEPPPMPAPVVVHKDVGGFVNDYQAQTAIYRVTGREVRLHECRSACTLALGLPNVCVYPDSILKFHQAYDPHNRRTDELVSQQLFDSYPVAVRARLGGLARDYRVLRGSELIALGIRNCNETRTIVATATVPRKAATARPHAEAQPPEQGSILDGLVQGMMAVLGQPATSPAALGTPATSGAPAKAAATAVIQDAVPLPPPRPTEFGSRTDPSAASEATPVSAAAADHGADADGARIPPQSPEMPGSSRNLPVPVHPPKVISGAQAILPARFAAYAAVR